MWLNLSLINSTAPTSQILRSHQSAELSYTQNGCPWYAIIHIRISRESPGWCFILCYLCRALNAAIPHSICLRLLWVQATRSLQGLLEYYCRRKNPRLQFRTKLQICKCGPIVIAMMRPLLATPRCRVCIS